MSEKPTEDDPNDPSDNETVIRGRVEPNDEATVIRGKPDAAPTPQEGNNEATIIRSKPVTQAEGSDDATVLRTSRKTSEPNDDATLLRAGPDTATPNDDATVLREASAATEGGNDAATVLRPRDRLQPEDETHLKEPAPEEPESSVYEDDAGDDATILRVDTEAPRVDPRDSGDEATVLRASGSESATILRAGNDRLGASSGEATILRAGGGDENEDATIMRSQLDDDGDDATILRDGVDDDDDRTIINDDIDDDSTIIGEGARDEDTTYVASAGNNQPRSKGNSEAGRLLKNRFVLEEKIGSGGMGDVYKALDLRQQEAQERDPYIAIKLLNENFARHKDAFLSLQRETSRTRGIPHPNIMGVYDFDREGDTVFMSMELLDGKPLDDYLKEHPEGVSEEDAWNIIDHISLGLNRAHAAGIVHSDFKPGNIFYTKDKVAKVFDFGIARAVSNPNELEADGEKTVFDAGSLGALTPTYASYEMLKGLEPSKSDDVYAVALVAYELFMGKHPYDRVPADKAYERGIKPKPVPFLKRRHWRALRKALELKGEDRTQTIDEFREGIFSEDPPYLRYAAIGAVILGSMSFAAYQAMNQVEKPEELVELENVMAASETTIRNSVDILENRRFDSEIWHANLSTALNRWRGAELQIMQNEEWVEQFELQPDPKIQGEAAKILDVYLDEIERVRQLVSGYDQGRHEEFGVTQAIDELTDAREYMDIVEENYRSSDPRQVDELASQLDIALRLREDRLNQILAEEQRLEELEIARVAAEEAERERLAFEKARLDQYELYLGELKEILKCKGSMPPEDQERLGILLADMRTQWRDAYDHHYPTIVNYLSTCIQKRIGYAKPDDAREIQARVLEYLPGETRIANLVIEDKDPCDDRKLEGKGIRNRSWCSDRLSEGGSGPELVVIPAQGIGDEYYKYAISRAEVKVVEYNQFCENTGCEKLPSGNSIPATGISVDQARAYTAWLSSQSGQTYRLPTVQEWDHAARTTNNDQVDQNINCTVDSRGVKLGEKLLNAISGRPNSWGLYNHVGNAREWALDNEGNLMAVGGAHTDPRSECTVEKRVVHNGGADAVTGFRIVREIERKS